MPLRIDMIPTALGFALLGAMLLLAGPGVNVAQAETSRRGESFDIGGGAPITCEAPGEIAETPTRTRVSGQQAVARLHEQLQREMAAAGDEEAPIVLNGRGYNYRVEKDPAREIQILKMELDRAAQSQQAGR